MMHPRAKQTATLGAKVLVVLIPAVFAYWQSRSEAKDKARAQERDLAAAYEALKQNVEETQKVVKSDHDTLMKLVGYSQARGTTFEAGADAGVASSPELPLPAPPVRVDFEPVPPNVGAAREQYQKRLSPSE